MKQHLWKMAYNEAVTDLMMELCICESEAKKKLDEWLEKDPLYLYPLYRQFSAIQNFVEPTYE